MKYVIHPASRTILPANDWFVLVDTDEDIAALADHLDEIIHGPDAQTARIVPEVAVTPGTFDHDLRAAADAARRLAGHVYAGHPDATELTYQHVILDADFHLNAIRPHD